MSMQYCTRVEVVQQLYSKLPACRIQQSFPIYKGGHPRVNIVARNKQICFDVYGFLLKQSWQQFNFCAACCLFRATMLTRGWPP